MSDLQILFNKIRETHLSEKIDKAADACRANVTIYHYDTLQTESKPRRLPDGIEVIVFDETGKPFRSKIDGGKACIKTCAAVIFPGSLPAVKAPPTPILNKITVI